MSCPDKNSIDGGFQFACKRRWRKQENENKKRTERKMEEKERKKERSIQTKNNGTKNKAK